MAQRHALTIERSGGAWVVTIRYPPEMGTTPDIMLVKSDRAALDVALRWMELIARLMPTRKKKG